MVEDSKIIGVRLTPKKLRKDVNKLKELNPDKFKPQDICREALKQAVREYKSNKEVISEDLKSKEEKLIRVEEEIEELEESKVKLSREINTLKILLQEAVTIDSTGESRKMRLINAVTRIKIEYQFGRDPSDSMLAKLSHDLQIEAPKLRKLGFEFYMGDITREDLEELDEEFLDEDFIKLVDTKLSGNPSLIAKTHSHSS